MGPEILEKSLEGNIEVDVVKTSAAPEIVPKQSEKVQRVQISYSNDGEEQINDLMPNQQSEEQQHQPMVVTQLKSIIASPTETLSTQVLSQSVLQSSPQNNSDTNKGKEGCNRGRGLSAAI